jgi:hypothetical protein
VSSFVPDGSCYEAYRRAVFRWGSDRTALVYEPLAEDVPMNGGPGRRLDRQELRRSIADHNAVISFSREYAAAYYTYSATDTKHFVIFDDERSFLLKASAARSAGIRRIYAAFPDISQDIDTFERGSF